MRFRLNITIGMTLLSIAGCMHADLVVKNGTIVTMDDRFGEVQAVAMRDGRIVAVGNDADIARYVGRKTRVIDLEGRFAMPGFIEGHGHFTGIGSPTIRAP